MEKTIKINDKVIFTNGRHTKGMNGVVEQITPVGTYVVRLDKSLMKFFNLIEAQKHEISLADSK
jgi:hypothetical protein